jgi:hypothetical protein
VEAAWVVAATVEAAAKVAAVMAKGAAAKVMEAVARAREAEEMEEA